MKKIKMFYLEDCPYCKSAFRALEELKALNPAYAEIEMECIDEHAHMDIAEQYDYQSVPTLYVGEDKIYEAYFGHSYDTIYENVKRALDAALTGT